jgi:hypothetical protein
MHVADAVRDPDCPILHACTMHHPVPRPAGAPFLICCTDPSATQALEAWSTTSVQSAAALTWH